MGFRASISGLTGPVDAYLDETGTSRIDTRAESKLGKGDRRIILLFAEAADRRRGPGPGHRHQACPATTSSHTLFYLAFPLVFSVVRVCRSLRSLANVVDYEVQLFVDLFDMRALYFGYSHSI